MGIGGDRNKRPMWYALYQGTEYLVDDQGRKTGVKVARYTNPVKFMANVSPADGSSEPTPFGTRISYDKTMVVFDTSFPLDENSKLWVGVVPVIKEDGTTDTPHNYVVSGKADGLLSIVYALKRVEVK